MQHLWYDLQSNVLWLIHSLNYFIKRINRCITNFLILHYKLVTLTVAQVDACQKLHSKSQVTSWLTMVGKLQRSQWNLVNPLPLAWTRYWKVLSFISTTTWFGGLPHFRIVQLWHSLHRFRCQIYHRMPITTWYCRQRNLIKTEIRN